MLPPEDRASQLTGNCRSPWGLLQCAVAVAQRVKCFCLSGFWSVTWRARFELADTLAAPEQAGDPVRWQDCAMLDLSKCLVLCCDGGVLTLPRDCYSSPS